MDSPGLYFLVIGGTDFAITLPGEYVGDWVTELDGMRSATVQCDFRPGSGGTDVRAYLQTSIDDGNTPVDIACMVFTAADRRVATVNALETTSVPISATDAALVDDTVLAGVLGTQLRLKLVSTGTWVNTFLGGRVVVR
jgi:hypothetical protein